MTRAPRSRAGHTIHAELTFNDAGELADFVSEDRYQASPDGKMKQLRWSTPLHGYRTYGSVRLPSVVRADGTIRMVSTLTSS